MASGHFDTPRPGAFTMPGQVPWSALLSVLGSDGLRATYPFRHPRVRVGRRRSNDLSLQDQAVSGSHCEFVNEAGYLVVRDLQSGNGTWVNEKRVSEARLRDGDVVRVGATRITVALSAGAKGSGLSLRRAARKLWPWLLALGAIILAGLGALLARHLARLEETRLRTRYEQSVRAQVTDDACGLASPPVKKLREVDAHIAGRSVALTMKRGALALVADDLKRDQELVALYRAKVLLYDELLAVLEVQKQHERDGLEKITRLGARLGDAKDRKFAFWAEGMLGDRLSRGDAFALSLRELRNETARLGDLVDSVLQRRDTAAAAQLGIFGFAKDMEALLRSCQEETERASSGALGALNALDDE